MQLKEKDLKTSCTFIKSVKVPISRNHISCQISYGQYIFQCYDDIQLFSNPNYSFLYKQSLGSSIVGMYLRKRFNGLRKFIRKQSIRVVIFILICYIFKLKFYSNQLNQLPVQDYKTRVKPLSIHSSDGFAKNIPIFDYNSSKHSQSNSRCAPYPRNYMLEFSNNYWQVFRIAKWKMYLSSAYYDTRMRSTSGDFIRILALMTNGRKLNRTIWCQIWSIDSSRPVFSKVSEIHAIWPFGHYKEYELNPYLISCPIPKLITKHPESVFAVSIVRQKCKLATNNLRVNYDVLPTGEKKEDFAVCVKGLDFPHVDRSFRIIEWIELLRMMGVHKIYFYEYTVHPKTKQVLEYYARKDAVELTPFTLPALYSNEPFLRHEFLIREKSTKRRVEIIPYNDCFYRLMYKYNYIGLLDVDEIIIPIEFHTWSEMMKAIRPKSLANRTNPVEFYAFAQNGCFFEGVKRDYFSEIPSYFHMLQHIYKLPPHRRSGVGMKGFADPNLVLTVLNHQPGRCLYGNCSKYLARFEDGQLQHYRHYKRHCGFGVQQAKAVKCDDLACQDYVTDNAIWKFKDELIIRVNAVLRELDFAILPEK